MKERLLVTGYGGFVAGSIVKQASPAWEVSTLSRSGIPNGPGGMTHIRCDLRETPRLRRVLDEVKPDAIIHAAAIADIDYCESHREDADEVNVGATRELHNFCQANKCRMVFCSTDTVFDGRKGMYTEEDRPDPLNFYAETKIRAEQVVLQMSENMLVARLALVVGLPVIGTGNSFLARMIASLDAGKPVHFPEDEIRTPIDVVTVGRALLELAGSDHTGILHLAGNTRITRFEMGIEIARRLGYPSDLVRPTPSATIEGRASRPSDASLENAKARRILRTPMRSLLEGLDLVLETAEEGKT